METADRVRIAADPQQARIAQLASAGLSNPEITAQLFISRRTVECHLREIFTKPGITRLTEHEATSNGRSEAVF